MNKVWGENCVQTSNKVLSDIGVPHEIFSFVKNKGRNAEHVDTC